MANLHEVILALRSPEAYPILDTIRYALYRDKHNLRALKSVFRKHRSLAGRMVNSCQLQQGGIFNFANARCELIFLTPDLVRVSWTTDGNGSHPLPYAIARDDWPELEVNWQHYSDRVEIKSTELVIIVSSDGYITYQLEDGRLLRREAPPVSTGDGWRSQAFIQSDESLYGMGEHAGAFNLRGQTRRLWNTDPGGKYGFATDPIYMPIPVYLGIHRQGSYLVFHENYHRGAITVDPLGNNADAHLTVSFEGGMLRHYFIPGPPARAIERYTELTGRPEMPPRWSLGYHQSRWGYKTEKDVDEIVAGFMQHDLPISAIHLDIDYMDGYRVFTVDRDRFPDFPAMTQELKAAGIRTVAIIDPGVRKDPGYDVYDEGLQRDTFCRFADGELFTGLVWPGWTVFPDFTDAKTRDWWGIYYHRLLDAGVDGIWHDMNEPCCFAAWGALEFPRKVRHHLEGQDGDHEEGHNIYALLMNQAGYEALRRFRPEHRPWLVSRSGWAGQQRYAWNWTGDTESTWEGLKMTLMTVLSLGLSGFPFSGPDIGGFSGDPSDELYLRWFQLAAFLPFFRTHSAVGTSRREPWVYGEKATDIIRKFLRIRYKLMPYLYTLAWEASQTGYPLVRPIFWYSNIIPFPLFSSSMVDDSFFLGDVLLVAPVMEASCESRQVGLPPGYWYDFWDDTLFEGASITQLFTGLDQIPVFVRAGSVIPMEADKTLLLHVYLLPQMQLSGSGNEFSARLYTDAGDGFGAYRLDEFKVFQLDDSLSIQWDTLGEYPFKYESVSVVLHGARAEKGIVDNKDATLENGEVITGKFSLAHILITSKQPGNPLEW